MKMTMRKMMAILATLAVLCAVLPLSTMFSAVADDANLVANGDFTDGINGWYASQGTTIEAVDGTLHGDYNENWGFIGYDITLEPNTDYVLTFDAKSINNGSVTAKLNKTDWTGTVQSFPCDFGADWQTFTWEFNSGSYGPMWLYFQSGCEASANQEIWLDNVSLVKATGGSEPEVPADDNLIVNGDFETGDNSGWEIWQSTSISADAAKDGAFGAHLKGDGGWGGMLNQTMTVEAGKEYKLSFWINVNAMGVNVQVKNGAGAAIEGAGGWFDANKKDHKVEWIFTATDDKVLVNFCGSGSAPEDAYVDNFSLVATGNGSTPDEPDDALIPNGDFETGSLAPWDNLWGSCPKAEIVEGGIDGGYALEVISKTWNHVRQTNIPVEANTNYKITAWAKNAANMCLLVKNGGDSVDIANVPVSAGDEWTQFTVEFNSGSYTTIIFSLMGGEGDSQYGTFDNIVMEKVGGGEPVEPDQPDEPDEPDEPVTPPTGGLLDATFDSDEFDGILSTSDISVADGELQFNVTNNWGNIYAELAVEANTNYEITFRAKSKLGKGVWVKLHKADWTGDIGQADLTLSTSWKEYTVTLNSGDNTSVWLLVQYAGYGSEGETIWFDYINVKKAGGSTPDQPSAGLVTNGDFETGNANGWQTHQSTNVNGDAAYKGSYGANLIGDGGWGGLMNQDVKVEAGETYIITLWVCPITGGVNLQIKGATKIDEESDNTWMNSGELNGWTERKVVVVADSDTLTLNFCGGGNNVAADIYLDEIVVVKKGETPPVEDTYPIKNAGFETGDLTSWINLWNGCNVSFDNPGHDKSNYAMNFEGPGPWKQVRQDKIPVEPNTDYTLIAYTKNSTNINIVVKTGDDSANIADYGVPNDLSNSWIRHEISFNSGSQTEVCVLVISNGDNGDGSGSAIVDNVQIYKKGEEPAEPEPDGPATEGPMVLDAISANVNRPVTPDANMILNGSFEDAEGGQWQSALGNYLYVVDDETAPSGNKSLYFNTSGVADTQKIIFYMDVVPNTDYVFSVWVKGAFISADNRFNATVGVTDWKDKFAVYAPDEGCKLSTKDRQIVPPCWDNEWHLRAVQFNSGVNVRVGIGFAGAESQMWLDDMALFTVDKGIKYSSTKQVANIATMPSYDSTEGGCADEDNLIPNGNMDGASEFWSDAVGFQNGFVSFPENKYEYGTSMKYTESSNPCGTHMIKWIDVEPNTDYTFSVNIRVVKSGYGKLALIDSKDRNPTEFLFYDFDQFTYGSDWFTGIAHFNSGEFDRIGICVVDGGGIALIDNMRLFKKSDAVEGGVKDSYVKPPYTFGSDKDPHMVGGNPDSPSTGVPVMGAFVAIALVPSAAAVAFKLRRKREDEE